MYYHSNFLIAKLVRKQTHCTLKNYYIALSEEILSLARQEKDTNQLRRRLFYILETKLEKNLYNDNLKKAFWINIYHSYYLIISNETKTTDLIFDIKRIKIARSFFSLNDIEHGILRKFKFKMGFGYISNPFYSDTIKKFAITTVDYRILFALRSHYLNKNPIEYYSDLHIEEQLTLVTKDFIDNMTHFNHTTKKIEIPHFFFLYNKDFGGIKSIKNLIETVFKTDLKTYKLRFKSFDKKLNFRKIS
jgi:hypothetical protein